MIETTSIDTAIEQVERLYESVAGRPAPSVEDKPYAVIPPERAPEEYVQEQVNRLIGALSPFSGRPVMEPEWRPAAALWESPGELRLIVDLPGVERDNVRVSVTNGILEISGARGLPHSKDEDRPRLYYAEHPFGNFRRTFALPRTVRTDQLRAEMRAGALEICIPKESDGVAAKTLTVAERSTP